MAENESFLVTLAYRVKGDAGEVADWAADVAKATRESLDLEIQYAGIAKDAADQHIEFVGVFLTKGVK